MHCLCQLSYVQRTITKIFIKIKCKTIYTIKMNFRSYFSITFFFNVNYSIYPKNGNYSITSLETNTNIIL